MITRLIVSRRVREVITVGAWPALGLAQARIKAGALAGKDVSTLTLGALLDAWHTDIVRKTYRRPRDVQGYIERLDPALKVTKLRNLERLEVRHALRRYAEERGPIAANRALSILKTALRFAVDAGYLEISPVDRLSHVLGDRWHIPKEHSKNHRAHWVALSRQALALLRAQDASRELIFGTATDT